MGATEGCCWLMVANDCLDFEPKDVSEGGLKEGKDSSSLTVVVFLALPLLAKREEEVVGSVVNNDVIFFGWMIQYDGIGFSSQSDGSAERWRRGRGRELFGSLS